MKKVVLLIGAAAVIVAVAAVNVNVSFVKANTANISLANARALAKNEYTPYTPPTPPDVPAPDPCALSATTLLSLSSYKMALTNVNRAGGIAIRNNSPASAGTYAYGLDVEQTVASSRTSMAVRAHALAPTQVSASKAFGVFAMAGNAVDNYGVFAGLSGCGNGAALFATTNTTLNQVINGKFAGYFQGDVHVAGKVSIGESNPSYTLYVSGNIGASGRLFQTSDERCKANVKNLGSALDKITKLRPVTYNFRQQDVSKYYKLLPDSVKIESEGALREYFGLGKGRNGRRKHIGFLAQELQKVFPELVQSDGDGMLSVDYISLVPVLAGAIQEQSRTIRKQDKTIQQQDATIDKMTEAIELLSKRLEALESANGKTTGGSEAADNSPTSNISFTLFPNPASSSTVVTLDYTMRVDAPIAIALHNTMGQKVKQLLPNQHQQAGNYSIQIPISNLLVGTYIVRLVSGNYVESKQLLIN